MVKYPVLIGEMAKRRITKKIIAEKLGICERALRNKLAGKVPFTWPEAQTIRNTWFSEMLYDELFAVCE